MIGAELSAPRTPDQPQDERHAAKQQHALQRQRRRRRADADAIAQQQGGR